MPPSRGRMGLASATRRLMGARPNEGQHDENDKGEAGTWRNDLLDAEGTGRYQAEEHERNAKALILLLRRLPIVPSGGVGGKKSSLPGGSASLRHKLKPPPNRCMRNATRTVAHWGGLARGISHAHKRRFAAMAALRAKQSASWPWGRAVPGFNCPE